MRGGELAQTARVHRGLGLLFLGAVGAALRSGRMEDRVRGRLRGVLLLDQRELALHLHEQVAHGRAPLRVERPAGPSRGGRIEQGVKVSARVEGGADSDAIWALGGSGSSRAGEARRGPKRGSRLGGSSTRSRASTHTCDMSPPPAPRARPATPLPRATGATPDLEKPPYTEARNNERARTDPCVAPVKRFRTLTDGSSNCRGRRRAHARARPGPADSRVLLARDRSTARSGAERATSASPRSPSRSARARAAFPRRDIVVVAPHRARVATREDAWHARARPWTFPRSGRLLRGKARVPSAGASDATRTPPPRPRASRPPLSTRRTAATRKRRQSHATWRRCAAATKNREKISGKRRALARVPSS